MSLSASQRFRLGVFVTAGTALLLLFSAVPLVLQLANREKKYFAYFEGESLSGLEQGAIVKFHGVPVGKASRITYDPRNLLRVKVEMLIQEDFPLKTDMYCQTGAMGITGLKYVEIMGGTNEAPLLKANSEIPSRMSMMANITGKAEVIVGKIELLLNHLTRLTNPDSLASIKSIVDNVASITDDVHDFIKNVRPRIETSTRALEDIVTRVDSISRNLEVVTGEASKTIQSGQIQSIVASADTAAQALKEASGDISVVVKQSREDIRVSMDNLREALQNANELTKVLAENPSLLLKGEKQQERVR
jgi:phospholipid/cholesterol/gamma-HCH transport system substrate-binding protein